MGHMIIPFMHFVPETTSEYVKTYVTWLLEVKNAKNKKKKTALKVLAFAYHEWSPMRSFDYIYFIDSENVDIQSKLTYLSHLYREVYSVNSNKCCSVY